LLSALNARLTDGSASHPQPAAVQASIADPVTVLDSLDLSLKLPEDEYDRELEKLQGQLNALVRKAKKRGRSTVVVFEGWDAGGKGGAIRRIIGALDARDYLVIPVAAPTDEERA